MTTISELNSYTKYKIPLSITIFFLVGLISSFILEYSKGADNNMLFLGAADWGYRYLLTIISWKVIIFITPPKFSKWAKFLSLIFFCTGISNMLTVGLFRNFENPVVLFSEKTIYAVELIMFTFIARLLSGKTFYSIVAYANQGKMSDSKESETDADKVNITSDNELFSPQQILGRGDTPIDVVISSIKYRAVASRMSKNWSLIGLTVIVLLGGGASIGSELLNETSRIRALEQSRNSLIKLIDTVQAARNLTADSSKKKTQSFNSLLEEIKLQYQTDKSFQGVIHRLEAESYISWRDIAVKVTIAALTLFLVQIVFNIYKYNQQQMSHLFSKAETIELYRGVAAEHKTMRSVLIKKIESPPGFEKGPRSPMDRVISIVEKSKRKET